MDITVGAFQIFLLNTVKSILNADFTNTALMQNTYNTDDVVRAPKLTNTQAQAYNGR